MINIDIDYRVANSFLINSLIGLSKTRGSEFSNEAMIFLNDRDSKIIVIGILLQKATSIGASLKDIGLVVFYNNLNINLVRQGISVVYSEGVIKYKNYEVPAQDLHFLKQKYLNLLKAII